MLYIEYTCAKHSDTFCNGVVVLIFAHQLSLLILQFASEKIENHEQDITTIEQYASITLRQYLKFRHVIGMGYVVYLKETK